MFIGLVGAPSRLSYEALKAARALTSGTAALFNAVSEAAIGGILARGSLVAGAGAAGWFLGQRILESLESPITEIPLAQKYSVPDGSGLVRVLAFSKTKNNPQINFDNVVQAPVVGPVLKPNGANSILFGILTGTPPTFLEYGGGGADLFDTYLEITSITKVNGDPVEGLRKVPAIAPTAPIAPFKAPTVIPVPNLPGFPIVPTVVPNPSNDPEKEDDKAKSPGVIVQVPEYGLQFNFGIDGVQISRYRSPATGPFEFPNIPPTNPPNKAAEDACPCPEPENKNEEIICRLKALEKELLDDGFTVVAAFRPSAQSTEVSGLGTGFFKLETNATQVPANAKRISYPAPGVDTIFIGNVCFLVGGVFTEQLPIRTASQVFFPPEGSTGYVISGAFGFEISSAYYVRTKKDYIDLC